MPRIVNACAAYKLKISEGPVYAPFNLGQCLNVTLLDLVAVVTGGSLTAYKL